MVTSADSDSTPVASAAFKSSSSCMSPWTNVDSGNAAGQACAGFDPQILKKYKIEDYLGRGSYGVVCKMKHRKTGRVCAIKKCYDVFQNSTDAQRVFREIMYLQALRGHENIVELLNVHRAQNNIDIYIVTEYMESDLSAVIQSGPALKEIYMRHIIYQLISALKYVHEANLVHRDVKPSNVLLRSDGTAKLCDLGLMRSLSAPDASTDHIAYTNYVATRWYRAPEVIVGSSRYDQGVDMWAVGCVIIELISRSILFPGKSSTETLKMILKVTGVPAKETITNMNSDYARHIFKIRRIELPEKRLNALEDCRLHLKKKVPRDLLHRKEAVDLTARCLQFCPFERITASKAIEHEYVRLFCDPHKNLAFEKDKLHDMIDDTNELPTEVYLQTLYKLIGSSTMKYDSKHQRRVDKSNQLHYVNRWSGERMPSASSSDAGSNSSSSDESFVWQQTSTEGQVIGRSWQEMSSSLESSKASSLPSSRNPGMRGTKYRDMFRAIQDEQSASPLKTPHASDPSPLTTPKDRSNGAKGPKKAGAIGGDRGKKDLPKPATRPKEKITRVRSGTANPGAVGAAFKPTPRL